MFGATPGLYKNLNAAHIACEAYSIEEHEEWCVVEKEGYYRACRKSDLEEAVENGHVLVKEK